VRRGRSALLLDARYPGVRFEVVNAGMAVNSHVTRQSALGLARHEPDLFVVYLGNNEVVGPYGASSAAAPLQADLAVIRAGVWARSLRLGQLFERLWISTAARRERPVAGGAWRRSWGATCADGGRAGVVGQPALSGRSSSARHRETRFGAAQLPGCRKSR